MKIGKDKKVIPDSLTPEEAELFITFLNLELWRHKFEVNLAEGYKSRNPHPFWSEVWDTAIERHRIDIEGANKVIDKVKKLYDLPYKS